jgi:hypothetical protein
MVPLGDFLIAVSIGSAACTQQACHSTSAGFLLLRGPWLRLSLASKGFGQPRHRRRDGLARVSAEPDQQSGSWRCCGVQSAHGANDDALVARRAFDCHVREASPEVCDEMHSLVRRIDRHLVAEPLP